MLSDQGNESVSTRAIELHNGYCATARQWPGGPILIRTPKFLDKRGIFFEEFNQYLFWKLGSPTNFVQDNMSLSYPGVLRGMHIQRENPQGKLVHCAIGRIQDVIVDLRPGKDFGRVYDFILSGHETHAEMLYVPPGFAHGFFSLEESLVHYKCTTLYDKKSDGGINPFSFGFNWVRPPLRNHVVSEKDMALPSLVDYQKLYG